MKRYSLFLLIIFFATVLFFHHLGVNFLVSFDEAFYAVIAKEVINSNHWLTFTFGGEKFFAVSPLYIWLEAVWFKLFSPTEFGVRFFSAASSLLTVSLLGVYFLKRKKPVAAVISGIVLLSSIKFLFLSRTGNVDALLTFFTTLSILLFLPPHNLKKIILGGLFSGLAFLTKGLFGLFPLVAAFVYSFFYDRKNCLPLFFSGLGAFFLVTIPWHVVQIAQHGENFLQGFYGGYMATKIGSMPFLDRFWWGSGLWQGMKLWLPIGFVAVLYTMLKISLWKRVRFFVFSIALYLSTLSFVQTHNDWYLMPLYPLFAIIIGHLGSDLKHTKGLTLTLTLILFTAITLFHLIYYHQQYFVPQTTDAQVMMIKEANIRSNPDTPILLDDFYFPVAVFYSTKPIVKLRTNRDPTAAIGEETLNTNLLKGSLVLTSTVTVESLKRASHYPLILEKAHGELLLYRSDVSHGKIR